MGFTALHILLWFLTAVTLTTQELVRLSVSHKITAECFKQVTLNCDVATSTHQLSIKHMEWSQGKTSLCSVDSEGEIITHPRHSLSEFHCVYEHGQLSLIFQNVQPLEGGESKPYRCKLQSNKGATHNYTTVELQECCGTVEGVWTSKGPSCTFNHVNPDGDVHWFQGSRNLSDGSLRHNTTKHVVGGGWLTIHSYLEQESSDVPYSCSLRSTKSGRYIASILVKKPNLQVRDSTQGSAHQVRNGVGSHGPMGTFLCISILLAVTLK